MMPTALKGTTPKPIEQTITQTSIRQFWKEHGATKAQEHTWAAQEFIYDAWEAPSTEQTIALARQALATSPFCMDAYNLLARHCAKTHPAAIKLYRLAVFAGEIILADELKHERGYFWGILETRPFMRALGGLAADLWAYGSPEEAVHLYQYIYMLGLNPNDNQGIRYILLFGLLSLDRDEAAQKLLDQHDEASCFWLYSRALLAFKAELPGKNQIALEAIESNPFVIDMLTNKHRVVKDNGYYSPGDKHEASYYVHHNRKTWRQCSGAIDWLQSLQTNTTG